MRTDYRPAFRNITLILLLGLLSVRPALAERTTVTVTIRNHLFEPAQVEIPANTKVRLLIDNQDPTSEEFECYALNREKVIMGGRKAVIFIGPVAPGRYPFFGEFHPDTAIGEILAR